ncbi:hypothetical protein X975_25644, partial [Stegodyphus mimosarum]
MLKYSKFGPILAGRHGLIRLSCPEGWAVSIKAEIHALKKEFTSDFRTFIFTFQLLTKKQK